MLRTYTNANATEVHMSLIGSNPYGVRLQGACSSLLASSELAVVVSHVRLPLIHFSIAALISLENPISYPLWVSSVLLFARLKASPYFSKNHFFPRFGLPCPIPSRKSFT